MPREIDPLPGAIDTALTAMMDLDTRLDRLAGHWFKPRTHRPGPTFPFGRRE